jgi:Predicted Zn-dependent peptidases
MPINNRVLENGIRLITEPIAATEAVAIGFWFPRGSRDERPGEEGITHFVEHMLFKGTTNLSAYDLARFFDRIGGYFNAFTERETLCVHCLVPRQHALGSIDILSRMVYDSRMDDDDVERERSVIVSEILSSLDDPEEIGLDLALESMYPNHSFSRPVAASVDEVESLSGNAIRSYRDALLRSVRPLVVVAGNFDGDAVAFRLTNISVDGSGEAGDFGGSLDAPRWKSGISLPVSRFAQSQIFLSCPVSGLETAPAWYSFSVLNAIIGDSVSSRLYQSLREEKGLCYSVGSFFMRARDAAFWMACAAVPPEKTSEAVFALVGEMDRLRSSGFTAGEFEDAQEHLCGDLLLSSEDIENRMKRLARQWLYNGEILTINESIDLVRSLDASCSLSFIETSLRNDSQSLLIYSGKKQTKEIRKKWKYDIR